MGRRRGFIAEWQHQTRVAEQRQRAKVREQQAAVRRAEVARNAAERARVRAERASEAERKRLERESAAAYVAMRQAEVDELNTELAEFYESIDTLLQATLHVDDYVDLEKLRWEVQHPPFPRPDLEQPVAGPEFIPEPVPPTFELLPPVRGVFGRKKRLAEAQARSEAEFARARAWWEEEMRRLPGRRRIAAAEHAAAEGERKRILALERDRYEQDCADRESAVAEHNADLDQFISDLSYGVVGAVQEYVAIVLANSQYPDDFQVQHQARFDPDSAELNIAAIIPSPDTISSIKNYRYIKSSDEIAQVPLSQKDAKDRYLGVVQQVALRTLHEVFESDRREVVQSISLELGAEAIDPAVGRTSYVPFLAVSTSREIFSQIDLSAVVPAATLDYLGASVSKNPLGLVPANTMGVRSS